MLRSLSRVRTRTVLAAACSVVAGISVGAGLVPSRPDSDARGIISALEATHVRERGVVESFTTSKTFTITHDGRTSAEVVTALRFTAPDLKRFAVLESRGSGFLRERVINRMMDGEIEFAKRGRRGEVELSRANYEFVAVQDDGDAYVIDIAPRRSDELLFKGRIWITKDGFHLRRVEGEPARIPSFWTERIHFVSEFAPVRGVWLQVRTVAHVTMRWFGEYQVLSKCGPYDLVLARQ